MAGGRLLRAAAPGGPSCWLSGNGVSPSPSCWALRSEDTDGAMSGIAMVFGSQVRVQQHQSILEPVGHLDPQESLRPSPMHSLARRMGHGAH